MTIRLPWKLMAIIVVVIVFIILTVWLAIDYLAADYFMVLMERYKISPEPVHAMFVAAVHRYLLWASLAAMVLATVLSFVMVKRVLKPLSLMTRLTRNIAAGDYAEQIPVRSQDEIGQLAVAFNRMTASLQKIERLRRGMMVDVAHELRTPLTNIRGYLEALLDGVVPGSDQIYTLLHEETLRLAQLVEDVLQLAQADAAVNSLQMSRFDLQAVCERTWRPFRNDFTQKAISVTLPPDTGPVPVQADEAKIIQVMQNLIQNALQYTPADGRVALSFESAASEIKTTVANTGGEIDTADLPHIFERFYRGEKSRSREHGGAGIGLAIVKELVEAHGGSVGAQIHGDFTEIWFTLPKTGHRPHTHRQLRSLDHPASSPARTGRA